MLLDRWRLPQPGANQAIDSNGKVQADADLSHPAVEDLPGDLERAAKAGRQLSLFFSEADPGHSILMFHAKRKAEQLRQAGQLTASFIKNADHTFSERVPRRAVVQAIAEHLTNRYS
jgi:phospholipase/lecithinase/hemolysin